MTDLSNYRFEFSDYECRIICTTGNCNPKKTKKAKKLAHQWVTKCLGRGMYQLFEVSGLIGLSTRDNSELVAILVFSESGFKMPPKEILQKWRDEAKETLERLTASGVTLVDADDPRQGGSGRHLRADLGVHRRPRVLPLRDLIHLMRLADYQSKRREASWKVHRPAQAESQGEAP